MDDELLTEDALEKLELLTEEELTLLLLLLELALIEELLKLLKLLELALIELELALILLEDETDEEDRLLLELPLDTLEELELTPSCDLARM